VAEKGVRLDQNPALKGPAENRFDCTVLRMHCHRVRSGLHSVRLLIDHTIAGTQARGGGSSLFRQVMGPSNQPNINSRGGVSKAAWKPAPRVPKPPTNRYSPQYAPINFETCFYLLTALSKYSTVDLDMREGENTRKATAYSIIPLNVAHFACETHLNAQKTSR
jgi:hypothetical protein